MKVKTSLLGAIAALAAVVAQAEGPVVGYMLDVSRNKVPTMASLYRMVDVLAELGYNQFQLYTEHTFAYRDHAVVWNDASPMTAEEVRALDAYCAGKGIDLVPNQNSFGHLVNGWSIRSTVRSPRRRRAGSRLRGNPRSLRLGRSVRRIAGPWNSSHRSTTNSCRTFVRSCSTSGATRYGSLRARAGDAAGRS